MPLYYDNGASVTYFSPASVSLGRYVAHGEKWGGALGTGVDLTFSFPGTGPSTYALNPYPYSNSSGWGEYANWFALSNAEQQGVRAALLVWERHSGLQFTEMAEGYNSYVGELRFAYSRTLPNTQSAHAYYPYENASAGDTWFNPNIFNLDRSTIPLGSFDFVTILHEVGHAVGLKHTFEGANRPPAGQDNYFYSIMSYTASPWSAQGDNYASFYPTTPMYFDLVAIEMMYGRRDYATGNNSYVFKDGVKYWQAIHDTGGSDIIIYQGVEGTLINLNQGAFSSLSESIQFRRPDGSYTYNKATVTIGPWTVIEHATGGSGPDQLIGNNVGNVLSGAGGNDILRGNAGNDHLRGGFGNDTMVGGAGYDFFMFNTQPNAATNFDRITDYTSAYDTMQFENAVFTRFAATGALNPNFFRLAVHALDINDYLVYDRSLGRLMYDANGSGAGQEVLVAVLVNKPALTYQEFQVI
jgi:Ca2+-binding RTX toxin-like protein